MINLELLTEQNIDAVRAIHREDIPVSWVDDADTLWELTQYGLEHNCIGHTYAVKQDDAYIGVILLGEAIPWETDPEEMKKEPFYRLMGFVIDNHYRSQGIGSKVLEMVIDTIYAEYGERPIALCVHKDNHGAARFYEKHGFRKTDAMEGNDAYFIRYPKEHLYFVETPRLVLRKVTEKDFSYFRADLADKEMDRMMLRWPCETEEEIRLGFEWFLYKEERAYAVVHKETGETIGNLTVYNHVPECVAAHEAVQDKNGKSLSFAILPAFRRKGYMYEAVSSVIDHLFREEKADYINCGHLSYNAPSKALQEKLGFTYLLTEQFQFDGQEMESIENILWSK